MRERIALIITVIIIGIVGYNYIYQDHRDVESETAEYTVLATDIAQQFSENLSIADTKYINVTIKISGKVSEIENNTITLEDKVFCQFTNSFNKTVNNDSYLVIKGRVIGYDDLLEQVKLDQCIIN
ncbi:OB-fold protein [Psychroserpens sp. MEBiC05023]